MYNNSLRYQVLAMVSYQLTVILFSLALIGGVVTQENDGDPSPQSVDDWLEELREIIFNIFGGEETGEYLADAYFVVAFFTIWRNYSFIDLNLLYL